MTTCFDCKFLARRDLPFSQCLAPVPAWITITWSKYSQQWRFRTESIEQCPCFKMKEEDQ